MRSGILRDHDVMNRLALARTISEGMAAGSEETVVHGVAAVCDPLGGLYLPEHGMLVVSDLHLEKGAAFARRGMMLPPYDTIATLNILAAVIRGNEAESLRRIEEFDCTSLSHRCSFPVLFILPAAPLGQHTPGTQVVGERSLRLIDIVRSLALAAPRMS